MIAIPPTVECAEPYAYSVLPIATATLPFVLAGTFETSARRNSSRRNRNPILNLNSPFTSPSDHRHVMSVN